MEGRTIKLDFFEQCGAGDLEGVTAFVNRNDPDKGFLTEGLVDAVRGKNHRIAEFLLQGGAFITSEVVNAACIYDKSIEIFQLLLDYGWDINARNDQSEPVLL